MNQQPSQERSIYDRLPFFSILAGILGFLSCCNPPLQLICGSTALILAWLSKKRTALKSSGHCGYCSGQYLYPVQLFYFLSVYVGDECNGGSGQCRPDQRNLQTNSGNAGKHGACCPVNRRKPDFPCGTAFPDSTWLSPEITVPDSSLLPASSLKRNRQKIDSPAYKQQIFHNPVNQDNCCPYDQKQRLSLFRSAPSAPGTHFPINGISGPQGRCNYTIKHKGMINQTVFPITLQQIFHRSRSSASGTIESCQQVKDTRHMKQTDKQRLYAHIILLLQFCTDHLKDALLSRSPACLIKLRRFLFKSSLRHLLRYKCKLIQIVKNRKLRLSKD